MELAHSRYVIAESTTDRKPGSAGLCPPPGPRSVTGMSATTSGNEAAPGAQRQMYRELREQARREQRRRQQKIERLVQQHGRRDLKTFRHPSR